MADLETMANEAIKQLNALKSHLAAGEKSRGTMAGVARQDWEGRYRDEFETGLKAMLSQSGGLQSDIDGLIGKIKRELAASQPPPGAGGH